MDRCDSTYKSFLPLTPGETFTAPQCLNMQMKHTGTVKKVFSIISLFFVALATTSNAAADESAVIAYRGGQNYVMVERTDLLRYDNGKYTGLLSREVQSYIANEGVQADGARLYDGNFYVVEDTKHDKRKVRSGIHEAIDSAFKLTADGELIMIKDNGYPSLRSFPSYSKKAVKPGDSWVAKGERAVDPQNNGTVTRMPILVEYSYLRDDVYNGEDVYVLAAKWATRYGKAGGTAYTDPDGDPQLRAANGSHNATVIISKRVGNALVIKDIADETFSYADGSTVRLKGTISFFTRYPPAYNSSSVIETARAQDILLADKGKADRKTGGNNLGKNGGGAGQGGDRGKTGGAGKGEATVPPADDTNITETDKGLKLVMRNLHFKSDSAELLPGEEKRLDKIAQILKAAPDSQYLVEGHTADTGNPAGEQKLSEERAFAIAQALVKRGIKAEQFICKGLGARQPAADNSTREGKAANRRVEITILK